MAGACTQNGDSRMNRDYPGRRGMLPSTGSAGPLSGGSRHTSSCGTCSIGDRPRPSTLQARTRAARARRSCPLFSPFRGPLYFCSGTGIELDAVRVKLTGVFMQHTGHDNHHVHATHEHHCHHEQLAHAARVPHEPPPAVTAGTKLDWTCPMHPEIVRDAPGNCPICGMALEPRTVTLGDVENVHLKDMMRRFWVSVALSLPLLAMAMAEMIWGSAVRHALPEPLFGWAQL